MTTDEKMDKVSASGFAYGYISSVIPFGISLVIILVMGMDVAIGYQIGFCITALWWGLFTIPMIKDVKQRTILNPTKSSRAKLKRLGQTFLQIKDYKIVFIFLIAYFYIDGVDTIIKWLFRMRQVY